MPQNPIIYTYSYKNQSFHTFNIQMCVPTFRLFLFFVSCLFGAETFLNLLMKVLELLFSFGSEDLPRKFLLNVGGDPSLSVLLFLQLLTLKS